MKTSVTNIEELKNLFIETFINNTDKVTKVANHSVINGVAYGVAKVSQKALKDIALVEQNINPDMAYGSYLDKLASNWGIASRFGSSGSSTYVKVVGEIGTTYEAGTHTISSNEGVVFDVAETFTVGDNGYGYVKVQSQTSGSDTNVKPFSLTSISPIPTGHKFLTNEFIATGGRDIEEDEYFRNRIKEGSNIIASQTLSKLEQVLMRENSDILKIFRAGNDSSGNTIIKIATVNGSTLTQTELDDLLEAVTPYLALTDFRFYENIKSYGVVLENITYQEINIRFKCKIRDSYDTDEVRIDAQSSISEYFDYKSFINKGIIEWDDLFLIIKNINGIEYISDTSFKPNKDIVLNKGVLPRIKSFLMYDLDGNIISDNNDVISPVYYPSLNDINTQNTI